MKTTILKQSLLLLSSATLLAACGGDGGDSPVDDFGSNPGESGAQGLLYAYPDNGQGEVPTKAPIALRFTSNVAPGNVKQNVTLCCDDAGENLDFEVERVGGEPRGVLLTPTDGLAPGTQYTVEINDLRLSKGTAKDQTLTFTTRTLQEGPKSEVVQEVPAGEDEFQLSRTMPNGSELEPVMDFSAFRFQFTQPIDRATASYGDGNSVVLRDSEGAVVEAGLLVDGAYMTVDPTDDYLTPGETYTLTLSGLESTYGETFAGETLEFTPKDSSPRGEPGFLVQKITQSGTSRLTGKGINQVPVNGTLLGEDVNVTQAQSDFVIAELADVTQYTDVTPIRLPKGTLLEGTPIEMVKIGGEVDAGFGSGDVTMRVLSDATGYLVPNPYTENHPDKLRIVHLFMDVGIATANPKANGGFTQNLLHIHLVGVAEVDPEGGVLNIDATGMVEPDILGQEYGYGLLSFQLQSYKDQTDGLLADARTALEDTTPPTLQSWTLDSEPGDGMDKTRLYTPGDPIVLNYNEPLDPESVKGSVNLYHNDQLMDIDYRVDGAALIVKPIESRFPSESTGSADIRAEWSITYSPENSPNEYRVQLSSGITDLAGNSIGAPLDKTFELPVKVENRYEVVPPSGSNKTEFIESDYSPMILSAYPGFPCVLSEHGRDLAADLAGRCAGGFPGIGIGDNPEFPTPGTELDNKAQDDILPVMDLAANDPIIVQFSKTMDTETIKLGETFIVERLNEDGSVDGIINGSLEARPKKLVFRPTKPWDWSNNALYRYTILSAGFEIGTITSQDIPKIVASNEYTCGENSVCDSSGLPLQTQPLGMTQIEYNGVTGEQRDYAVRVTASEYKAGGPDFIQFFRAAEPNDNVMQVLNSQPISDINGNFFHEEENLGTSSLNSSVGEYTYDFEEYGATNQPDTSHPDFDPNGVKPAKNSAKLLSRYNSQPQSFGNVKGANFGCAYQAFSTIPMECPEHKFTYLMSSMVAEVTDEISDQGIKVKLWPSQVVSTSMDLYGLADFGNGLLLAVPGFTGAQILRMRFNESETEPGVRNQPITAWITDRNGELELNAELDLYVDTPQVTETAIGSAINTVNMRSYPIHMKLTGSVNFTDDGRMQVEQYNVEAVNILLRLHNSSEGTGTGYTDIFIPEYGSRLNFISEPIK